MRHRHNTDDRFLAAHADVDALLQRLSHDVSTLEDQGDPVNRQAMADAGERYETAEVQFGKAQSVGELQVARSIVVEGLQSTRGVRTRLGLDPGPEPAPPAVTEPAADEPHHSWAEGLTHSRGGVGTALGAGAAGGLLGLLGGSVLGEVMGDGDGGGGWGEGGGWDNGGGDWGG
jgi:hypothetical protein